jgi:ankyrin repeat protein
MSNIFQYAATNNILGIQSELADGRNINGRDHDGMTALHHAAAELAVGAVEFLLRQNSIDPTIVDNHGRTAAQLACDRWGHVALELEYMLVPLCHPNPSS